MRVPFASIPDDGRLWLFATSRPLDEPERRALDQAVEAFLDDWAAHGTPLTAGYTWLDGRVLAVGLDERAAPPSGCSIDALLRGLKDVERALGVGIVDHAPVWYRDDEGAVRCVSRAEFGRAAADGAVSPDTLVYDLTLTRVGDARAGRWAVPAREAWHGRAFFREQPATG
ncbi:MAG: hypothetical protein D6701_15455 [Gemmatimonadetes bacterium]|nr:MAG: hypothetical protein D6701_15455 [Gemmatimonadota bacterium]